MYFVTLSCDLSWSQTMTDGLTVDFYFHLCVLAWIKLRLTGLLVIEIPYLERTCWIIGNFYLSVSLDEARGSPELWLNWIINYNLPPEEHCWSEQFSNGTNVCVKYFTGLSSLLDLTKSVSDFHCSVKAIILWKRCD